jgi:SAM-dependent methyltransferase
MGDGDFMAGHGHASARHVVAAGYDQIAETYPDWASHVRGRAREHYTRVLLDRLPDGAAVLDLGCATGELLTRQLAERFTVTGVDISPRQIELARQRIPRATFIRADMTELQLPPASFDAVAAFYSLTHVPREDVTPLLRSIYGWLRPGGLFVASLGAGDDPGGVEEDWLGVPMYFSAFDSATSRSLVEEAGFEILSAQEETDEEDGMRIVFLWIVARKPDNQSA